MKHRLSLTIRLLIFVLCIATIICIIGYALRNRYLPLTYQPEHCRESEEPLDNPYRGFYHLYGYTLSEKSPEDAQNWSQQILARDYEQLVLLQINMKNYPDSDLSENALNQLDLLLKEFTSAGKQLILRFIYDWDGNGLTSEPQTREQISVHMTQTAEIVNKYKSHIFLLQGISTGNYGEMHHTNYSSEEDITFLMNHLASVMDSDIFLSVRTPAHLRGILKSFEPLADAAPYDGTLAARLGLYNDGMLGSVYDLGTYDDTSYLDSEDYLEAGTREEELAFQNILCQFVPNGGETVVDNPYNDIENAIGDLNTMHVSYLSRDHDGAVLDKWLASTYEGINGLDYIEAHLGYRYVLTDSGITFDALLDNTAVLHFSVQNTGFAPAYRRFDSVMTLTDTTSGLTTSFPVSFDNRTLQSGETATLTLDLPVRTLEAGTYELAFSMTDSSTSLPIYFANEGAGTNIKLGTLTIP